MADKTAAKGRAKGAGAIYKDRNRFYLKVRSDGHAKTYLLRNEDNSYCTTRKEAEEAAARMTKRADELETQADYIDQIAQIKSLKTAATFKFDDIWTSFLNAPNRADAGEKQMRAQKSALDSFISWLKAHGCNTPCDITNEMAGEYMSELGHRVSNKTFNEYLIMLRSIFGHTLKASGLKSNPFEEVRRRIVETSSRHEFTPEQVQAIFDGFRDGFFYEMDTKTLHDGTRRKIRREFKPMHADEMRVLLKMCCYTGCDGQSGCLMKWSNIDFASNMIHYVREKTRKASGGNVITLPIHSELREELEIALTWRRADSPYILPNVAERYKYNCSGVQKDVMKIIRCALDVETTGELEKGEKRARAANIYSLHSFRHTFVSFCANAGVPMAVVASIVGHGSPAMTRHYTHISTEAKTQAIGTLPMLDAAHAAQELPEAAQELDARADLLRMIDTMGEAEIKMLHAAALNILNTMTGKEA